MSDLPGSLTYTCYKLQIVNKNNCRYTSDIPDHLHKTYATSGFDIDTCPTFVQQTH